MAQSLSKLYIHIIFHVKSTFQKIKKDDQSELYSYIGSIIKQNDSIPIIINGVGDHVHILCVMSKNIALAKLVEEIKKNSSRWIKTKNGYYQKFGWQVDILDFQLVSQFTIKQKDILRVKRNTIKKEPIKKK